MKRWLPVVLVACSTPPTRDNELPASASSVVEPQRGGHGAAIELLAITDDAGAALTQDEVGGTRLWPALDGSREPVVLQLAMAKSLTIGRVGDGFVVAALDQGGGAEVLRVTRNGGVIARTSIAPEPPIESLTVAAERVVAVRADQTLAMFAASGQEVAHLAAPARSRIADVVTRHGHTLVLLGHDGTTSGRWLDGTSWGAVTPDFQLDPGTVTALSPSGTRLAVDFDGAAYVLDTETGKIIDTFGAGVPVGFTDDDTLVKLGGAKLAWQKLADKYGDAREEVDDSTAPAAIGDGTAVSVHGPSLVLHTRERVAKLGYRLADVAGLRAMDDGLLVTGAAQEGIELDRALALRRVLELPDDTRTLTDLVRIDARFALATHTLGNVNWWTVSVLDLVHHTTWQTLTTPLAQRDIRYEPSTRLLAATDSVASYLTSWDPAKQAFETWYRLDGGPHDVHLLDPREHAGLVAIALRATPRLQIAEIHGDDLKVGAPIKPRHTYLVDGYVAAVDRRARVYVIDGENLVVYEHGREVTRIAGAGGLRIAAQPNADYIALYGDQRIRLYDTRGGLRWEIAAPLAQQVTWLGDELVVDYAGGIGKIDVATGALNQRVCGWSFGFSALSSQDVIAGDSICDAP